MARSRKATPADEASAAAKEKSVTIVEESVVPEQSTTTVDDENDLKPEILSVVIPYLKSAAQGRELLYAIRSIAKNFEEDFQLVVIGDKEDWFSDEILFIEKACIGTNPQSDVIDKMKEILLDQRIGERFVFSNDDIYFVGETTLEDIQALRTAGKLVKGVNAGLYNQNLGKTIQALESHGYPTRNFSTHTPFFFEKSKMMDVFEMFPQIQSEGLLLSSMYYNLHNQDDVPTDHINGIDGPWSLRVISKLETKEKKESFRALIGSKHFLNHSEAGFSNLLMDWIDRQFPLKCRFEK